MRQHMKDDISAVTTQEEFMQYLASTIKTKVLLRCFNAYTQRVGES